MTQSSHISWQVNVSLRCTSISPKTSETKLQVSEAQLQVFSPWAQRHVRSIVWMRIFKARLLAAWPLAQWCASFGGLAETFSRKVSRWVKPRFFCKKKSFTQNYNFRCNMQPVWIQSKVETDPIYIICPSLRRVFFQCLRIRFSCRVSISIWLHPNEDERCFLPFGPKWLCDKQEAVKFSSRTQHVLQRWFFDIFWSWKSQLPRPKSVSNFF